MRENSEIIGHLIWHESSTDEHRMDDPTDEEDKQIDRKALALQIRKVEISPEIRHHMTVFFATK